MAHFAKYKSSATGHMFNHYGRSEDCAYVVRSNENIDSSRTHFNYNLAKEDQPKNQLVFLKERLSQVKVQKRSDLNILCDWVITAPKTLQKKDEKSFFKASYDFLVKRYGKENVISSFVHLDETTPHMHFAFIPVVEDKKRGGYKVSAKEKVCRNDLQKFHTDLSKHMEKIFGRDIGILNEATKEGNKSIKELKRAAAASQLLEMESRSYMVQKDIKKMQEVLNDLSRDKNRLQDELRRYRGILSDLSQKEKFIKEFSPQKSLLGGIKDVTFEDIEILKDIALNGLNANKSVEEANKTIDRITNDNEILKDENNKLVQEKEKLKDNYDKGYKDGQEEQLSKWQQFEWDRNKAMLKAGFSWKDIQPFSMLLPKAVAELRAELAAEEKQIVVDMDMEL